MKKLTILLINLLFATFAYSQGRIAVTSSGGSTTIYSNLDSAIINAQANDFIYLPGGAFSITSATNIDKKLTIIGAGYNVDSAGATGITYISGNIYLVAGGDGSYLTGFYLSGEIRFGISGSDQQVNDITINRCNLEYLDLGITITNNISNLNVRENIIRNSVTGHNVSNVFFSNNIFYSYISPLGIGCIFYNNIFLYNSTGNTVNATDAVYYNNIFIDSTLSIASGASTAFYNNLFRGNASVISGYQSINNIFSVPFTDIFQNYTGGAYSLNHNFRLKAICPGINAGNDGTDMGIYGGATPFKSGAVPFNPHISKAIIPSATGANGMLNINITVSAQDN